MTSGNQTLINYLEEDLINGETLEPTEQPNKVLLELKQLRARPTHILTSVQNVIDYIVERDDVFMKNWYSVYINLVNLKFLIELEEKNNEQE